MTSHLPAPRSQHGDQQQAPDDPTATGQSSGDQSHTGRGGSRAPAGPPQTPQADGPPWQQLVTSLRRQLPDDPRRRWVLYAGLLLLLLLLVRGSGGAGAPYQLGEEIPYSQLGAHISDDVEQAWVDDTIPAAVLELDQGATSRFVHAVVPLSSTPQVADQLRDAGVDTTVIAVQRQGLLASMAVSLLPLLLLLTVLLLVLRKGGLGGAGALGLSKRNKSPVDIPSTRFSDVAGIDEAVAELAEVVDFLHEPERYTRNGATLPRGFLLEGPPGTGKTLLARAVAGQAGVPFYAISGAQFVEMFAGLGASRMRDLFNRAREHSRAIIFIDEIDTIGKQRGQGMPNGATDEREGTLNQLLEEMDGFARNSGIIVMAATNRSDVLDTALLRPGRFDRKIAVPPPDRGGRERILRLYAADRPFDGNIDWAGIARRTPGMSGAELEQLLNEAALDTTRNNEKRISTARVENAIATSVLGRERRSALVTDRDQQIVAWHEAGHTVAALLLEQADDPVQVTIVPRGGTGGATWTQGADDQLLTRTQATSRLCVTMAGRAAEEQLLDGDYTQGAHGDLQAATQLATQMVAAFGMGEVPLARNEERLRLDGPTADAVDREAAELIEQSLVQARALLDAEQQLLAATADALQRQETLRLEQLRALVDSYGSEQAQHRAGTPAATPATVPDPQAGGGLATAPAS